MNNLKKIGLTALAGSLVATSVFAGELTATGSATLELAHVNGGGANTGKSFSQGNSVTLSGGGELDNGMTVALSFELDDGAHGGVATAGSNDLSLWDSHSLTIGMNDMGTFTFSGHGGSSASSAVDDTTGEIWDYQGTTTDPSTGSTSNNMISYNNSSLMDGLSITASYVPHTGTATGKQLESTVDYAVAYSGVEGLVVGYANGENKTGAVATHADITTVYANYTMGPVKVAYHTNEYETGAAADTSDQDFVAYSISYTVSENLSVMYGNATMETPTITNDLDQEVSGIAVSYTAGGMGIAVSTGTIDNAGYASATTADEEWWEIDLSFAF